MNVEKEKEADRQLANEARQEAKERRVHWTNKKGALQILCTRKKADICFKHDLEKATRALC